LKALQPRLSGLRPDAFEERDVGWTHLLAGFWAHIGRGAAARGDLVEAERYLDAAWRLTFSLDAAQGLSELRSRQGRAREASLLGGMMTFVVSRQSRRSAGPGPDALAVLERLRTVRLAGPALEELAEDVLLLVDAEGRVESVKKRTKGDSAALDLQIAKLGAIRFAPLGPVGDSVRVVRSGRITCTRGSRCVLALDLPNVLRAPSSGLSRAAPSGAEVRIVDLGPVEGLPLKTGQRVTLSARVEYKLKAGEGVLKLVARDHPGGSMTEVASAKVSAPSGTVMLEGSYRVPKATQRIDIAVPLESASPTNVATARAFFAVESR
jgi:hypothetical protein